jgi:hypothetical protein
MLWSTWLSILANSFSGGLSNDESFCPSIEDVVELFLPLEEVGNFSPFGSWGSGGRFFLVCILMGGDSSQMFG